MHKYRKALGIVLKKQNYRESDQIVTIWSYEFGKIRVLARALRLPKSKLAGSLQDLSLVDFEVTGKWPTIISAQVRENFKGIRSDLSKMAPAFYATELMLKTTADEQPNTQALDHLLAFLRTLDSANDLEFVNVAVQSFALKLLSCLGFATEHAQQAFPITPELSETMQVLRHKEFQDLSEVELPQNLIYKLKQAIKELLEYVLERELKSQAFLNQLK